MPGQKASPGLADVEVCYGSYRSGTDGVQNALSNARWKFDKAPAPRSGAVDVSRFSDPTSPIVPNGVEEDDSDVSSPSIHEGYENRIASPPQLRSLSQEDSGLPPTPPTLTNSDVAEANRDEPLSPQPIYADSVRNALHSQQSGQSITPVNQQLSPPTPDPSPPTTTATTVERVPSLPAMEQKSKPDFLSPLLAESATPHFLHHYPSSRAESFMTAREEQSRSPNASTSQVHLPEDDMLPEHWLDKSRELQMATVSLGDVQVEQTPYIGESESQCATPKRRSRYESPPRFEREDTDLERHISYVSEEDGLAGYDMVIEDEQKPLNGLGLSGAGLLASTLSKAPDTRSVVEDDLKPVDHFQATPDNSRKERSQPTEESSRAIDKHVARETERSAEDLNNLVYKRIREENVKRHSAISANSSAIPVGIIVPSAETTPRTLKRQTKCQSLRLDTSSDSKRDSAGSIGSERKLSHKKVRLPDRRTKLDDSPVFESSIRQVSSPAKLGPDASDMTALTYASLQDSPSMRKAAKSQPQLEHRLRHVSHGDRLSKNLDVRRTSLETSPPLQGSPFSPKHENDLAVRRVVTEGNSRVMNNMAVKRSTSDAPRSLKRSEKPRNPARGVIPFVATEPEEMSQTSKLRRFSREERLENNDSVRRTSLNLEHATESPPQPPTSTSPQAERRASRSSQDRALLPSSPRKSLDARFLHPTTTPQSISQFSDRTDVEILEASGIKLYPHNNESLLVVQNGSRPVSKGNDTDVPDFFGPPAPNLSKPIFAAQVDPPTPIMTNSRPAQQVDSPLTNPRAAPEPPVFKFIPPTPHEELDRELGDEGALRAGVDTPNKRISLAQRARRYSEIVFPRIGSIRRSRTDQQSPEPRARHLSPLWRPQGFWDDFDSDEDDDDFEPLGALPRGGDTSNVDDGGTRKSMFPRAMSKRLPGFRGNGGFLVGNSLGLDRHGTNNRRHYVSTGTRTLSKRQSEEVMKSLSTSGNKASQESLRKIAKARTFTVPFSGGMRAQWVGTRKFRAKMQAIRLAREQKQREKRRQELRNSIGYRVYHDGR